MSSPDVATMPSEDNGLLQPLPSNPTSDVDIAAQVTTDSASASDSDSENDVPTVNTSLEAPVLAPAPVPVAKWPGWPGHCVFRLIVPVLKAGMIIGRKGELIKKMCEETRARVRVLDGPNSCPDRIVLIHALEEPEALLSPAMDAALRVFKRVNGFLEVGVDNNVSGSAFTSIRLLVPSTQAINLIGKQGAVIKSIQEKSGASVRVLSNDEVLNYVTSEERIVELQGEQLKVLKALEAVIGHLRKFLVDPSVIPLFAISHANTVQSVPQEQPSENWNDKILLQPAPQTRLGIDYSSLPIKRDSLYLDRDPFESHTLPTSVASRYGMDLGLSGLRSTGSNRAGGGPIISQVTQTMQIPLAYAEDIIGIQGANIAYIRRSSGAILTVQESRGLPDEITVEVKGSTTQVQAAQQLIQEFIGGHKEPKSSGYSNMDSTGFRPSYTQLSTAYLPPSSTSMLPSLSQQQQQHQQPYGGGYVPSSSSSSLGGLGLGSTIGGLGLGSYSSYRL